MRLTRSSLRQIILEEIALATEADAGGNLSQRLTEWLGRLRALQLWFHGAHHVTSGPTFGGDHAVVLDRVYTGIADGFDADVEKAIGVTNDPMVGCPKHHLAIASTTLQSHPSPAEVGAEEIVAVGLALVQEHVSFLETLFEQLDAEGTLSLGLNDHLAAQANQFESYVYLLQQRAR